jgi:hypothetical protein
MAIDNKWGKVRTIVKELAQELGPRANFGVTLFPDPSGTDCTPGRETVTTRRGDSPPGVPGPTVNAIVAGTNYGAGGGMPTAQTLVGLREKLEMLPGKTFVILATDGGPNCNPDRPCDVEHCVPNIEGTVRGCTPNVPPNCCDLMPESCLDDTATIAAVQALADVGVTTYVIGVPGSHPYAVLLDELATIGGTARPTEPHYFRVDTTDQDALTAVFRQIAAKIVASCTFTLTDVPAPGLVNVYLDEVVVPQDSLNGWSIQGTSITLLGDTCAKVMNGDALDVRIVAGCPTILR